MRLRFEWFGVFLFLLPMRAETTRTVDDIVTAYVQALGGQAAIDAINSREVTGTLRLGLKATYYWAKPNKVLLLEGKEKSGFDGSAGWTYNKRKKVHRFAKGDELPMEIDANPLRYTALKQMYNDLSVQGPKSADDKDMDIIVAPNALAQATFYFDGRTHLLARIEQKGETSAYFTTTIQFLDYKQVNGVQFPFNIVHRTTDKGGSGEDFHIKNVRNNLELDPVIFSKPQAAVIISGGKR
jgi:hypothetical protein